MIKVRMFCPNCEKKRYCERIGIDSADKYSLGKRLHVSVAYRCMYCEASFNAEAHDIIEAFEKEQARPR